MFHYQSIFFCISSLLNFLFLFLLSFLFFALVLPTYIFFPFFVLFVSVLILFGLLLLNPVPTSKFVENKVYNDISLRMCFNIYLSRKGLGIIKGNKGRGRKKKKTLILPKIDCHSMYTVSAVLITSLEGPDKNPVSGVAIRLQTDSTAVPQREDCLPTPQPGGTKAGRRRTGGPAGRRGCGDPLGGLRLLKILFED